MEDFLTLTRRYGGQDSLLEEILVKRKMAKMCFQSVNTAIFVSLNVYVKTNKQNKFVPFIK